MLMLILIPIMTPIIIIKTSAKLDRSDFSCYSHALTAVCCTIAQTATAIVKSRKTSITSNDTKNYNKTNTLKHT